VGQIRPVRALGEPILENLHGRAVVMRKAISMHSEAIIVISMHSACTQHVISMHSHLHGGAVDGGEHPAI
jgi:hypothetical protein